MEILGFSSAPSPKALVLLEFYANTLRFAAECRFTTEKTSAFFSIMRANHEETVHGLLSLDQSLLYFKELLLLHSVQRPPYSVGIFSFKDVTLISDYANSTCVARARRARARAPLAPNPVLRDAPVGSRPFAAGEAARRRLTQCPPAHPRAQVLQALQALPVLLHPEPRAGAHFALQPGRDRAHRVPAALGGHAASGALRTRDARPCERFHASRPIAPRAFVTNRFSPARLAA